MRIYHFFSKNTRDNKDSRSRKDSNDNRNSIMGGVKIDFGHESVEML